ncbi:hypothetical protein GIB67_009918 [Kingdonia uniflora]|uniref:Uncharacterized protein n=1 Tax=Kingdonia uniflora TaxID=39325 RepID=A0A7J7L4E3_9MAGN|nr:hypothetical protein GIB67_009918 [Kingdonia uniflora]
MGMELVHYDIIYCGCKSSDDSVIGGVEPIEDHLLSIRIQNWLPRSHKTIYKSHSMKKIFSHGLVTFSYGLKFTAYLLDTCS